MQRNSKISWKEIHNLVTAAQARCPPQYPLYSVLLAVFVMLHTNSATAQPLPSLPTTYHWRIFTRETYNGDNIVIDPRIAHLKDVGPGLRSPYTQITSPLSPALSSAFLTEARVSRTSSADSLDVGQ